ncbi:MAG: CaiB/BaiF CoA-transferase family protein [Cyclobacteriaceae bacterium]
MTKLPLAGVTVLEFCQYLSGPSAGLRLADLGARVIKIESPKGDACRKLAIEDLWVDNEDSLLFHTINRNKESYAADLKDPLAMVKIKALISQSDVMIHNFRPGVMSKLGLDYDQAKSINKRIIYTEITGFGALGPWSKKPGQDLLIQAKSGLMYTSGNSDNPPVPFGLAIADIICGAHSVQGILAALIRMKKTGIGAKLELSLMESLLDFQFELLTTYYRSDNLPLRSETNNGHTLLGAPYGLHKTRDGFIAIAMVPLNSLAQALNCESLRLYTQQDAFKKRDEIKKIIAAHLINEDNAFWMDKLQSADLWAMEVKNWKALVGEEGFQRMGLVQEIGVEVNTTRCPIRLNNARLYSNKAAPKLGANNDHIEKEFGLI